jgi:Spy/CpxP family protein refolding chaperone
MRTIHYVSLALVSMLLVGQVNLSAQPGNENKEEHGNHYGKGHMEKEGDSMIPKMTDDQKAKIKDLRIAHFKEIQPLRNQLGELKAKQKTLTTAEKPDMKLINANIDEITKVMNQLMKSRSQLKQQIRALLTDEQRVFFDMRGMRGMGHQREFREEHKQKD